MVDETVVNSLLKSVSRALALTSKVDGRIEGTSAKTEDENVALASDLVETVGGSDSGGLTGDTEDVEVRYGSVLPAFRSPDAANC